jgi:Na+/glutamate symporter
MEPRDEHPEKPVSSPASLITPRKSLTTADAPAPAIRMLSSALERYMTLATIIAIVGLVAGIGIGIIATLLAIEQRVRAIEAASTTDTSDEDEEP